MVIINMNISIIDQLIKKYYEKNVDNNNTCNRVNSLS